VLCSVLFTLSHLILTTLKGTKLSVFDKWSNWVRENFLIVPYLVHSNIKTECTFIWCHIHALKLHQIVSQRLLTFYKPLCLRETIRLLWAGNVSCNSWYIREAVLKPKEILKGLVPRLSLKKFWFSLFGVGLSYLTYFKNSVFFLMHSQIWENTAKVY
jgi:hypothetical protein